MFSDFLLDFPGAVVTKKDVPTWSSNPSQGEDAARLRTPARFKLSDTPNPGFLAAHLRGTRGVCLAPDG